MISFVYSNDLTAVWTLAAVFLIQNHFNLTQIWLNLCVRSNVIVY